MISYLQNKSGFLGSDLVAPELGRTIAKLATTEFIGRTGSTLWVFAVGLLQTGEQK